MKNNLVKVWGFCQSCFSSFETTSTGDGRYAQCPSCHSKTQNWHQDQKVVFDNIKGLFMCYHCNHLWFRKRNPSTIGTKKYVQCPSCRKYGKGLRFFRNFNRNYDQRPDFVKGLIKERFPRGAYNIIMTYDEMFKGWKEKIDEIGRSAILKKDIEDE